MNQVISANKEGFVCCNLHLPGEIFGYFVSYLSAANIICKVALICRSFYEGIHGSNGLFSRSVAKPEKVEIESNRILVKMKAIHTEEQYFLKGAGTLDFGERYVCSKLVRKSFLMLVINLLFDRPLDYNCNEYSILRCCFTTRIVVTVFKEAHKQKWITPLIFLSLTVNVLTKKTEPVKVKLNYISFWLDLWHELPQTKTRIQVIKAFTLLFLCDSKIKIEDFDGYFKKYDKWAQTEECVNSKHLDALRKAAWEILKNCCKDMNNVVRSSVVVASGLICLSKQNMSIEWKNRALNALMQFALDRSIDVLQQMANTILLLHEYTQGGFDNLEENYKLILRGIFNSFRNIANLSEQNQKIMQDKIEKIEKFIGNI